MNIVMAILALGFLIFIHELGHFWAARATGVRVEEFAVGFGPPILKYKRKGIQYRLNWIPLGGYVKMLGEDNPEAIDAPDSFNNRPIWARFLVLIAGVTMNLIGAVLILTLLYNAYGVPTYKYYVENVAEGPAKAAGMKPGDILYSVDGQRITSFDVFTNEVKAHRGGTITVQVERDGKQIPLTIAPVTKDGKTQVGISIGMKQEFVQTGSLLTNTQAALMQTGNLTYLMFDGVRQLVIGHVPLHDLSGPVEMIRITGQQAETGMPNFLYIVAALSVNLAVFNILPLPALDGGRIVFLIIEAVRRGKRVSLEKEASINFIGILFLLGLMVIVTFKDVFKLLSD
jgi:regulator of sigma E protease